jgi:hypothetical protein
MLKHETLKVRILHGDDNYKDLIRVYWSQRGGVNNGRIARVTVDGGKPHLLAMRGCVEKDKDTVGIDHLTREHMGVEDGQSYSFTFQNASWLEKVLWAANSAEPGARIATWIAIVSGVIGIIGLYPVAKEISYDLASLVAHVKSIISGS